MTLVRLTDQELILLNGQCRDEIQKYVDAAMLRLSYDNRLLTIPDKYKEVTRRILEEAETKGQLIYKRTQVAHCPVCKNSGGYAPYTRNSRYHRKGEPNRKRPQVLSAIELAQSFVRIKDRVTLGMCIDCWTELHPLLKPILVNIKADIPEKLSGIKPSWKWQRNRQCTRCGWEGHEGEMGKLPAIMGGSYPGECPECGAKNLPLSPTIIGFADGFTLVSIKDTPDV